MRFLPTFLLTAVTAAALTTTGQAADAPVPTAPDLAARLAALHQDGSSYVRLRLEIKGASTETLQVQIKQRRTKAATEVVYQLLWPKERKGESILLRKAGNHSATGTTFTPPNKLRPIDDLKEPLFGSDLSLEDVIDDFFAWDQQSLAGTEAIDGVACQILESKPGKGERSSYGSVKSWIDTRRLVPLRVEKYSSSGKLVRRIDTTRVVSDAGHPTPANLAIHGPRPDSATQLDGSKINHDLNYTDKDFTSDALKDVAATRE